VPNEGDEIEGGSSQKVVEIRTRTARRPFLLFLQLAVTGMAEKENFKLKALSLAKIIRVQLVFF
jgi:hypothetical protein